MAAPDLVRHAIRVGVTVGWTDTHVFADANRKDPAQVEAFQALINNYATQHVLSGTYYDGDFGGMQ